jgi:hypothetical protein
MRRVYDKLMLITFTNSAFNISITLETIHFNDRAIAMIVWGCFQVLSYLGIESDYTCHGRIHVTCYILLASGSK